MLEGTRRTVWGMHNRKTSRGDSLPEELLKIDSRAKPTVLKSFHAVLVEEWNGGDVPQEWKGATVTVRSKESNRPNWNYKEMPLVPYAGKLLLDKAAMHLSN